MSEHHDNRKLVGNALRLMRKVTTFSPRCSSKEEKRRTIIQWLISLHDDLPKGKTKP